MPRSRLDALPWVATTLTGLVLAAAWLQLYFVQVSVVGGVTLQQIDRNDILSKDVVDVAGFASLGIIIVGLIVRVRKRSIPLLVQEILEMVRKPKLEAADGGAASQERNSILRMIAKILVRDIFLLGKLGVCEDFQQWLGHFLTMWGFIGLALTTTLDAIVNPSALPLPLLHPVRVIGNLSGIIFMAGLTLAITRRLVIPEVRATSRLGDWSFLIAMYGTGATGFIVQWFADKASAVETSLSYGVHLLFIAWLLAAAPWTKFVHALWRPSWIVYSKLALRQSK